MVGFGFFLVVLTKSMGPLLYTLIFVPAVMILRPRLHLLIGVVLVSLVIAYPMLRGSGVIPTDAIIQHVQQISEERAQSLEYRFNNEDLILNHVADKPLFGWGGWGRFMVYDPATGESLTVVDGQWIIVIGNYGWLGYIAMFGLLALPVFLIWLEARRPGAQPVPVSVSALVLVLAVNMLDLLPNATLIPFTWLIAGALLGYAESMRMQTLASREARLRRAHSGVVLGQHAPSPGGPRTLM